MVVMSHLTRLRIAGIGMNSRIVAQLMVEGDIKHLMTIGIPLPLEDGTKCAMTSSATMELAIAIGNSHQTWITAKVATTNNQGFPTRTSTTILKGKPHHRSIGKSQYVGNSPLQVVQLRGTNARIRIGSTIVSNNLPRARIGASRTPRLQGITERMRTALYASTRRIRGRPPAEERCYFTFCQRKLRVGQGCSRLSRGHGGRASKAHFLFPGRYITFRWRETCHYFSSANKFFSKIYITFLLRIHFPSIFLHFLYYALTRTHTHILLKQNPIKYVIATLSENGLTGVQIECQKHEENTKKKKCTYVNIYVCT